ncbi:hypothetical protein GCM10027039_36990 [Terrabacter koreensis]
MALTGTVRLAATFTPAILAPACHRDAPGPDRRRFGAHEPEVLVAAPRAPYRQNMEERITIEGFDPPKNRRHGPDGDLVDVQGWLHAPVDWAGGPQLERAWRERHGRSRLGVGLCVANNPRRHIILTNVPPDLDFLRTELESLIAELDPDATSDLEGAQ